MPMEQERKINHNIIVECKDVRKTFITPEGEHPVVRNFDLEAKENEFLVLFLDLDSVVRQRSLI